MLELRGTKSQKGKLEGIGKGAQGEGIDAEGEEEGEIMGEEGETGVDVHPAGGRSMKGESQDGGEPGSSSTVVPGSREEGSASRCSMKVTWKELKHCLVETSHRWYAFEFGAYLIRMHGLNCW